MPLQKPKVPQTWKKKPVEEKRKWYIGCGILLLIVLCIIVVPCALCKYSFWGSVDQALPEVLKD